MVAKTSQSLLILLFFCVGGEKSKKKKKKRRRGHNLLPRVSHTKKEEGQGKIIYCKKRDVPIFPISYPPLSPTTVLEIGRKVVLPLREL